MYFLLDNFFSLSGLFNTSNNYHKKTEFELLLL